MKRIALAAATLAVGLGLANFAQPTSQSSAPPQAAPAAGSIFPKGERGPAQTFTGTVYVYPLVRDEPAFNCVSSSVTFEPGARSHWHTHPAGQILMVTAGVGYYQEKGQPIRLLRQGDVVKAQPGVDHWHGASPQQSLTHIALNVNTEKGVVSWGRAVTEQEYNSYKWRGGNNPHWAGRHFLPDENETPAPGSCYRLSPTAPADPGATLPDA
ncbi:(R)-mandelonitrile lyase [Hymenobacter chitinivorans]|uniref:Quercetin dioxygenase-like cupin family protein n=1 Tax=Hymenobacter chitinivorans DSM 11115 TaxID=1121954 RepID=A0A2M9BSM2_9BACT|nr:cupin domain-containing protein [Hymenobacter chitinivorans]PJJ60921.1 quercetin dioxygenase-like cupin family protein [Hymenobacter chitinivorans DSM 11115]